MYLNTSISKHTRKSMNSPNVELVMISVPREGNECKNISNIFSYLITVDM